MKRTPEFAVDASYEALLEGLNQRLGDLELPGDRPERPVVLIQGLPRSGTTLLYQLLAHTGTFAYPSNLIARFYRSPALGVLLQRLAEPLLERGPLDLSSRAGQTRGWWAPHEFSFFWRHHLGIHAHHELDDPDLSDLILQLGRMERAAGAPLLFKNNLLAYATDTLREALPTLKVVRITRDSERVVASILKMREQFHGDRAVWWSVRARDVSRVESGTPEDQVRFQIEHAGRALEAIPDAIDLGYDELCTDPRGEVSRIGEALGLELDVTGLPERLTVSRPAP